MARAVAPPKFPQFLIQQSKSGKAAAFEQSLPWAGVVETGGFGKVIWYSKDVIPWPNGHVECIVIASDNAIKNKTEALKEVIKYIHQAGRDIDIARKEGGKALKDFVTLVNGYIKLHKVDAIIQSLRKDLNVINYSNLNVDKPGLKMIMEMAVEGGILKGPIDIEAFSDLTFSTQLTKSK